MSDAAFLAALRLSDSFLPVGTYTASYGIEQYLNEDRIGTAEELGALVESYLVRIVGPADTVALGAAHRATAAGDLDGILAADERLRAATLPAEFRTSSRKAGRKLLELVGETDGGSAGGVAIEGVARAYAGAVGDDETAGLYPVALGVVTQRAGIGRREARLVCCYSVVTELLGAAQRLGRFGHTEVQTQLARVLPVAGSVCEEYAGTDLEDLTAFAPLAELMGMAHEDADRRLFMS